MNRLQLVKATIAAFIICVISAGLIWAKPHIKHGLSYSSPAMVWDEAFPLGNGLLGALVWGDGKPLKISLDRTDLWDLRPVAEFHSPEYSYQTMRKWVKEKRLEDLRRLYEEPYRRPGPTKIPAGRIELTLGQNAQFRQADLNISNALAEISFENGMKVEVFIHATETAGFIRVFSSDPVTPSLIVPPFGGPVQNTTPETTRGLEVGLLGYEPPRLDHGENWTGYTQKGWGEFRFAAVLMWEKTPTEWRGVLSIATSDDNENPLQAALLRCRKAIRAGFEASLKEHQKWWERFWDASSLSIPNKILERQWYLENYKFGCAARKNTPPITLQGPWTADNGLLPPWKGDYHHDLNTELSYWPAYSGNHLDGAEGYLNWLWKTMPNAKAWTRRFFDLPGLNVPMTADLNQEQIGGWHQYTHSATTAAWLAHHFYLHWRYSMDKDFLRNRAYPWLRETAVFLEAITEKDKSGKRTLPLSSSPEINDNRLDAWFPSITNYDLALIRFVFEKSAELADELNLKDEARHWRDILGEMPDFALDSESGKMLVAEDYPLPFSHRHFSHLMAIHPLSLIRWENGVGEQKIIKSSLTELESLGTEYWTGYSFSWLASLAARARDGKRAEKALEIFSTAFCLRNSFHSNGDQSDKGYSRFRYRPFTLEGNFAAAAGVQEMLLQSYSGTIRIFPAVPETWKDVSFKTLRAEGAFLVSAQRKNGITAEVEVISERGGLCRLENPFVDKNFDIKGISRRKIKTGAQTILIPLKPSQKVRLLRVD